MFKADRSKLAAPVRPPKPAPAPPRRPAPAWQVALGGPYVLLAALLVLLVAVPAVLVLRGADRDPVLARMDALTLPTWADLGHQDQNGGSRLCVRSCAWYKRIYQSGRPPVTTNVAFEDALRAQGWAEFAPPGCPKPAEGTYTCWQRDQYVLDLWVRAADCTTSEAHPLPTGSDTPGPPEDALDPTPTPSAPRASGSPSVTCPAAQASLLVLNRADPQWHG